VQELYWLDRIQSLDRNQVGEKALALSQLEQQGYPVLPGFAISKAMFREFIENLQNHASILTDLPYSSFHLDINNYATLQQVAQQSRQEILEATLPESRLEAIATAAQQLQSPTLILRSSLSLPPSNEQQIAGLLASQICRCEAQAIEQGIKQIWAALFSAKSLFYWQKNNIGIEQINLAILVQPISNAIASGTAEISDNCLKIQSTWGLGHSLVRGEVSPDIYEIQLPTGQLKTQRLGNKIRAYRLTSEESDRDCLQAYFLTPEEQESFSLDETSLEQLIELTRHLIAKQQNVNSFAWTLPSTSQLYITQLSVRSLLQNHRKFPEKTVMENFPPLLSGLAASPGQAIATARPLADDENLAAVPKGSILVAQSIKPSWLPWLKNAAGIIAEQGGMTSHAAIVARELGIPAIVNAKGATQLIRTGESLLLDGDKGKAYRLNGEIPDIALSVPPSETSEQLPYFPYPIATQLMVNLSQPSAIAKVAALPVDGVGLLRSEWMLAELLSEKNLQEWLEPSEQGRLVERLTQAIGEFARCFAPRPVFYRSFDTSDRDLLNPKLFELELQALKQVSVSDWDNVNLILPFVRTVEEFSFCRRLVEKAGLFQQNAFQLWIMAEVPSIIFLLPQLVQAGVQGIAIGTNDLTQLLLGCDREKAMFSESLNARHPAMLAVMEQLISLAKKSEIPCSICGQAPVQYPELIARLVEWGINSISVEPEAVERTYQAIARAEQRLLLKAARGLLNNRNLL
jgi:pyruvate,water dikinase